MKDKIDIEDRGICEVKLFRDKTGRTVKALIPYESDLFTKKNCAVPMFTGLVRIKVVPMVGDKSQVFEKDFEFPFTDDVKSVIDAFERFDEICQKRIDERNVKVKKTSVENPESLETNEK